MNTQPARQFTCRTCGHVDATWSPRCPSPRCLTLEGLVPVTVTSPSPSPTPELAEPTLAPREPSTTRRQRHPPSQDLEDPPQELPGASEGPVPVPLSEVEETAFVRDSTGLAPLDYVLGGGLVEASVILLACPPGIGKSTLTLQMLSGLGHRCLYATGEETQAQVAGTARRVGAATPESFVIAERDIGKILEHARVLRARTLAIDSIQTMYCADLDARPGTPTQLKECTTRLVNYAKSTMTTLWLIGQVTGEGAIAGPKMIEHAVDVVLELVEGPDFDGNERILRVSGKNRFGPPKLVGRFKMTAEGLVPVDEEGWDEKL